MTRRAGEADVDLSEEKYVSLFSSVWDAIWWVLTVFIFVAYLLALFSILNDLFRDRELNGGLKAIWLIFLVFLPFLTALIYLVVRGNGMAKRSAERAQQVQTAADDYIRTVAGTSPAEDIARAKELLDAGTITADEYTKLKTAALSRVG